MRDYLGIVDGTSDHEDAGRVTDAQLLELFDAAGSRSTIYTMSPGDTFVGSVESFGDRDWVALDLTAGETYQIDLTALSTLDTYLRVYDSSGSLITYDDDGGLAFNSSLEFTPTTSGTYYISAGAYNDASVGSYTIRVEELDPGSGSGSFTSDEEFATYLTDGYWEDQGFSRASWDVAPGESLTYDVTALTTAGRYLAETALAAWSLVTGIEFVAVTGGADMTFDDADDGAYASTASSGGTITSANINISTDWLAAYGTDLDSYSFQTYIHEIGHSLGLGHAGNYNGNAVFGVDNEFTNDSWQATVMSYFAQDENPNVDADYAYILTPMKVDIIAIQDLYGVSGNIRTGDTTYGYNGNTGTYLDDLVNMDQPVAFTILDDGGFDTLDLSGTSANQYIDLRVGARSDVMGLTGNLTIADGTRIELLIGGSGVDEVYGSMARNKVEAGAGDDILWGNNGGDRLEGGDGADTVDGGGAADRLFGDGGNDMLDGGNGNDRLWGNAGADEMHGGDMQDILIGGNGADTLYGERGADTLKGGRGDGDVLYGGGGSDTFVFRKSYGADTIADFADGRDLIEIQTGANDFSDLAIADGAGGAVVSFSAVTITLSGIAAADLDASDFLFT